ncbi:MAG: OsmC family protein [Alistipes sp.]|nr:OsmC family protein [Alistipes sp.]
MVQKITLHMNKEHSFVLFPERSLESLNPKEMLLYATADCAGRTIVGLLKEHVDDLLSLSLTLEGVLSTATVVAESKYNSFNIIYSAECRTLKEQMVVSRAINLAHDKYCGMLQMLRRIAPLSHETSIVATGETNS